MCNSRYDGWTAAQVHRQELADMVTEQEAEDVTTRITKENMAWFLSLTRQELDILTGKRLTRINDLGSSEG